MAAVGPMKLVGARVKRVEDPRFLTGQGRYVGGLRLPRMVEAVFVRSPHAHARILSIETQRARQVPGFLTVLTGQELKDFVKPLRVELVPEKLPTYKPCDWYSLAWDKVRYVGDPVAVVVAESRYLAEDAAELVDVEYDPLPPVVNSEDALRGGALVHEEWGDNVMCYNELTAGEVEEAFRTAAVVVSERFQTNRHHALPLETRGCVGNYEEAMDQLTLWTSSQMPHMVRTELAETLDFPEHAIRVIAPDVGGGFGLKCHLFPEEIVITFLTRRLRRPVRWIEDRRESLTSSFHAKEEIVYGELALTAEGTIAGIKARIIADVGAYSAFPWSSAFEALHVAEMLPGPYRVRNYRATVMSVATNKSTVSTYRGVGAPIAAYVIEHLLDLGARKIGMDPADVRLKNMIRREEFPYTSVTGMTYEVGGYVECLEKALEMATYRQHRQESHGEKREGKYRGIGISCYTEITALGSAYWQRVGVPMSAYESALIRMDPSGKVVVMTGTHSHGQAHETVFAQIAADELGVPFEDVKVILGDTAVTPYGWGTWGSRAAVSAGGAIIGAARKLRQKLERLAAHRLEVSPHDIEIYNGVATVRGFPTRSMSVKEIARSALFTDAANRPEGEDPGLEVSHYFDPPPVTFPNATHIAVVEVDPETGVVDILKYVVVGDCGKIINPMVVDGQIHGGVAQGLGGALLEHLVYDENGQLSTMTLMDYLIPTAADIPTIDVSHIETPSPLVPGGFKGAGEGGAIAPAATLANAVSDALGGVPVTQMPLTPERVHSLLKQMRR